MSHNPFNFLFNAPAPRQDRRKDPRQRAFLSGKLLYGFGHSTAINCFVVELSDSDVRIETSVMTPVPDTLFLGGGQNAPRQVNRIWNQGIRIGLKYTNPEEGTP